MHPFNALCHIGNVLNLCKSAKCEFCIQICLDWFFDTVLNQCAQWLIMIIKDVHVPRLSLFYFWSPCLNCLQVSNYKCTHQEAAANVHPVQKVDLHTEFTLTHEGRQVSLCNARIQVSEENMRGMRLFTQSKDYFTIP